MDLDPARLRLMQLLEERDSDMKAASLAIGRNAAYLHQYVFRGTPKVLPEDARIALAAHLGVDDSEIRHTEVPPRQRRTLRPREDKPRSEGAGGAEGFFPVPEIDVRASAGPGAYHDGLEETKATWMFPEAVIRHELRARPADLRLLTIDGDSAEPLLSSGDRIVIDTSQRVPVPPGKFVVWDGMGLVAKVVEHIPNSDPPRIVLRSVNPEYPTYERDAEEVNIVGRVVWAAKRF